MSHPDNRDLHNLYEVLESVHEGSQPSEPRSIGDNKRISLLNFDPYCQSTNFLNSPLSIEACKIQGIEQWELLAKTADDFNQEEIPSKFQEYEKEFRALKAKYYEKCRQVRVQSCIEARKNLAMSRPSVRETQEYAMGSLSHRSYTKDDANMLLMTSPKKVIDSGRKQLNALKRKQDQEIELIMETEKMKDRLDIRMDDHMQRVNGIRETQRAEFERREKEAQVEKVRREERKVELEEARQRSLTSRRLTYSYYDERDGNGNLSLLDNSMGIQSARGNLSSRSKNEVLQTRSSNVPNAEEMKKQFIQQRYEERMSKTDHKKKTLDYERRRLLEERRVSLETKQEEMLRSKSVRQEEIIAGRERRYLDKLETVRHNKQRIEEEKNSARKEKSVREAEHIEQIKSKLRDSERELEMKMQWIFEELESDFLRASKQRKEVLSERRHLYMLNYLKDEEAKGNMKRKEKMIQYQEEKLGERISAYTQRMSSRSRERESIIKESKIAIKDLAQERTKLKEEFAKMKQKLDKEHYNKNSRSPSQLSTFRTGYTCRSESSSRYAKSRPRSPFEQKEMLTDRRSTFTGLNDSGSFSTPNKKTRKSSVNHQHKRSGSKSLASTARKLNEEISSLMGVSNNTSVDMKDKGFSGQVLKSDVLETDRKIFDEEATLFAGKAFSIRSAQKIGLDDLIRVLDNEIQAQPKTQGAFKKSADSVMNTVRLHNEYIENLMHETGYLNLPWTGSKPTKP